MMRTGNRMKRLRHATTTAAFTAAFLLPNSALAFQSMKAPGVSSRPYFCVSQALLTERLGGSSRSSRRSFITRRCSDTAGSRGALMMASVSTSASNSNSTNSGVSSWDEAESETGPAEFLLDEVENDEENQQLLQDYEAWSNALDQALTKLEKKHNSLESEYVKAQNVEETVQRAQLLVSNLYLFQGKGDNGCAPQSAIIQDWENGGAEVELTLNPKYDSASAEADALFAQARKLKRGSQVLEGLLEKTTDALETLREARLDLDSSAESAANIDLGRLTLVQDRLTRTARATNFIIPTTGDDKLDGNNKNNSNFKSNRSKGGRQPKPELGTPASNVRKLVSPGGCTVWVGRNRRGNEYLSLTLARQNDVWMHSRGCPGAHVVIQNRRGGPTPTDECLQFGADLAIFYSDLRNEAKASVTAAEPKHLLKPRGAPLGAIKVREEWKTFIGRPDQVPEELKEARDQSGQSDEYRQEDKAKHRRRNRQAAEEDRAKRRQRADN